MKKIAFLLVITANLFFISCKKKDSISLTIGQSYQGGIIAYIDGTGLHGLIVSNQNLEGMSIWGCQGTLVGTSSSYGEGKNNTQKIISACKDINIAAKKCDDLILNGYSDWFLPTYDELQYIYDNLHKKGIGNFTSNVYASSTEASKDIAWGPSINILRLDFSVGYSSYTPKIGTYYIRPCRYF